MSKHFEDARYYLGRAAEHAKAGLKEELGDLEERVRGLAGDDDEPEAGRLDKLQEELSSLEERAEGEAHEAIQSARERLRHVRADESEAQ